VSSPRDPTYQSSSSSPSSRASQRSMKYKVARPRKMNRNTTANSVCSVSSIMPPLPHSETDHRLVLGQMPRPLENLARVHQDAAALDPHRHIVHGPRGRTRDVLPGALVHGTVAGAVEAIPYPGHG